MKPKDGGAALTDLKMWKALGYTHHKGGRGGMAYWKRNGIIYTPPPFYTSDLNAIVAEIEALGISFNYQSDKTGVVACIDGGKNFYAVKGEGDYASGPEALCAALLQYLKESKNA